MSKATERKAASEAVLKKVQSALVEAHAAADRAAEEFFKTARRVPDGHVLDSCGFAVATVYKPGYHFRTALNRLGEIRKLYRGRWFISNFGGHIRDQSITLHQMACQAACDVLSKHFPNENFSVHSFWSD
jgi:hypothetical protein